MQEAQLWENIRQEAKTNVSLQHAIDQVKLIYQLSKS
jgi:hypothetical protein